MVRALLVVLVTALATNAFAPSRAAAQPLRPAEVPEPLKPWVPWVMFEHKDHGCPLILGEERGEDRESAGEACTWHSRLDLELGNKRGTFALRATTYGTRLVPLPGNDKHWPLDVKVDGKGAVVVSREDMPHVELPPGSHSLTGVFQWDTLPEALAVPDTIGLVSLKLNGKHVRFPQREDDGTLFLSRDEEEGRDAEEAEENRLDLVVHRRVRDDIPLMVDTRIELFASGKAREVTIGPVLLKDFVPMAVNSPLPARIEQDGQLRVQVRPGRFVIEVVARHPGSAKTLEALPSQSLWVPEEVWVFQANTSLRLVDVKGVDPIDPQQTTLPQDWRRCPTYRVRQKEQMQLVETRRGDSEPEPDKLRLSRSIWLDFDGNGYTFRDRLTGTKNRGARLEMQDGFELGRVSVQGADQFITRTETQGKAGVQVLPGYMNVEADSRLKSGAREISAVSWAQDFDGVTAQLHLPPGWRLFSVTGADDVPGTWFKRWSLLELFLVMIVTLAVWRLFGVTAAVLACVALALSVPEDGSPQVLWLVVLGAEALHRVVPSARLRPWLTAGRAFCWFLLATALFPFVAGELRRAIYPTLELPYQTLGDQNEQPTYAQAKQEAFFGNANQIVNEEKELETEEGGFVGGAAGAPDGDDGKMGVKGKAKDKPAKPMKKKAMEPEAPKAEQTKQALESQLLDALGSSNVDRKAAQRREPANKYTQNMYAHDPKAIVQTGPGVPAWQWNTFRIGFSGPVTQSQRLGFVLLPPWLTTLLGILRAFLAFFLFLVLLHLPGRVWPNGMRRRFMLTSSALLLALAPSAASAADFPTPETLDELEKRLTLLPLCGDECATASRMSIDVQGSVLRLRIEISAAVAIGVPLPASDQQWLPERVMVDDKVADLLRTDDGELIVRLEAGVHRVLLEGSLPERDSVQLALPLKPHFVEAHTPGWTTDGLHEDGEVDDNLQLSRTEQRAADKKAALQQGALPPFVIVERRFELGLSWQLETTVRRLTPTGSAVVLEVPLVEGESVTSEGVRVVNGNALVNLAPQDQTLVWRSVLKERSQIVLTAKAGAPWDEAWQVDASPVWYFEAKGLPPVRGGGQSQFRPWPGESITVSTRRPEGVAGQTLTIDRSTLTFTPGLRASDSLLVLQMRSSRGGQHAIALPEGAVVQSVRINNVSQPIRQTGRELTLPVSPGAQSAQIEWREDRGISPMVTSPLVSLGVPSVNAELLLRVPAERWLLRAHGSGPGPAILFWSILVLLSLVAFVMSKVSEALALPLSLLQWFLLSLGLTQVELAGGMVVFGWFVLMSVRQRYIHRLTGFWFDAAQLFVVGMTIGMFVALFAAVHAGLVVQPDMQVAGNGANDSLLRWYVDRTTGELPTGGMWSVPLFIYRLLMLAWALWLALALIRWVKWGFAAFIAHGVYRPFEWRPWRWLRRGPA